MQLFSFIPIPLSPILAESANLLSRALAKLEGALEEPHAGSILRALVVLGVGAAGIYLMLPRGQRAGKRFERYLGCALATVALVLLVTTPIASSTPSFEGTGQTLLWPLTAEGRTTCYTFHILAAISLVSAVLMITSRNPVYSALWFAMVLLGNSGLFMLQGAEFLSAATIIVYAGAIVVTFLFVIMLAQPSGTAPYDRHSREPLLVTATGLILAAVLVGTLHYSARYEGWGGTMANSMRPAPRVIDREIDRTGKFPRLEGAHVAGLGKSLFVDHVASVEVIGVLLLAAVVGAMLIAGHHVEGPPAVRRTD